MSARKTKPALLEYSEEDIEKVRAEMVAGMGLVRMCRNELARLRDDDRAGGDPLEVEAALEIALDKIESAYTAL